MFSVCVYESNYLSTLPLNYCFSINLGLPEYCWDAE